MGDGGGLWCPMHSIRALLSLAGGLAAKKKRCRQPPPSPRLILFALFNPISPNQRAISAHGTRLKAGVMQPRPRANPDILAGFLSFLSYWMYTKKRKGSTIPPSVFGICIIFNDPVRTPHSLVESLLYSEGASTKWWILQRVHYKMDLKLVRFHLHKKPKFNQENYKKTLYFYFHLFFKDRVCSRDYYTIHILSYATPFCDMYNSYKIHHLSGTQNTDNHRKTQKSALIETLLVSLSLSISLSLYFCSSVSLFVHFIFR